VQRDKRNSLELITTPRIAGRRSIAVFLAALLACATHAAEPSPIEALRAKFPDGIPWRVEFGDSAGKSLGAIDMRITSARGKSCLGGMNPDGVRVEFVRKDNLSPTLSVTSYGVAKFADNKVKIDLTGGMCDAYLLMNGEVAANGSSTGDVSRFGMRGGNEVAKFRAAVQK
jgi:hypothetical protein